MGGHPEGVRGADCGLPDNEFTKTFFSSITRRLFGTVGVAPEIEFVATDLDPLADATPASGPTTRVYFNHGSLSLLVENLLGDLPFRSAWRDLEKSVEHVVAEINSRLSADNERRSVERIETIRAVFYQFTRAYIVGRVEGRNFHIPLVIALKNTDRGVLVDAVMLTEERRQRRIRLRENISARGPRPRRRGRAVHQVHDPAQAGKRALHRAGPREPGQNRTLSRAHAPPRYHAGQVRPRTRRTWTRDGVFHAPVLRRGVQDHPRPIPLPEERPARGSRSQVQNGLQARPRRSARRCAGIQAPEIPPRPLRTGAIGRAAHRNREDGARRRRRPGASTTSTSNAA